MIAGPLPAEEVAAFVDRCRVERLAAGLPEHIDDRDVLDRIASIVLANVDTKNELRDAQRA